MSLIELQTKIQNAKQLEFGSILDSVIDLYKKVWLKGFVLVLIMVIFAIVINYALSFIGISSGNYSFDDGFNYEAFSELYSWNLIYSIPMGILVSTVSLALLAAFYRMCKDQVQNKNVNDDYFYFFGKEYFAKVFMLGILFTVISTIAQLLFLIPYIYVYIPLSFISMIFANNPELSEMEIIKASFSLGNKKWFLTFGLMFVAGILGMLGIIACGIGLLFTMSIVYLPVFFVYKEVIGFDDTTEIDEIGIRLDSDF